MDESEFDRFADEYRTLHASNIRASGEAPEFFAEYKVSDVAKAIQPMGSTQSIRILDFGSGIGSSLPYFRRYFPAARVTCLDVSKRSLALGRVRFGADADFVHFDGRTIPYDSGHFDVAFAACVFHHIPQTMHAHLLSEMLRVLRRPGHLFVFEHNPRNPLTVRAVAECPFDENAELIPATVLARRLQDISNCDVNVRYRIFFPGFARAFRPLERYLTWCPLGAQYYVHVKRT